MSQYLVRRTRRFVEDNYAAEDEQGRRYLEFDTSSWTASPTTCCSPRPTSKRPTTP